MESTWAKNLLPIEVLIVNVILVFVSGLCQPLLNNLRQTPVFICLPHHVGSANLLKTYLFLIRHIRFLLKYIVKILMQIHKLFSVEPKKIYIMQFFLVLMTLYLNVVFHNRIGLVNHFFLEKN